MRGSRSETGIKGMVRDDERGMSSTKSGKVSKKERPSARSEQP